MPGPIENAVDGARDDRAGLGYSPWRAAFLVVVGGLVALHLTAVTFAALPPNRYSDAVAPSTGYLGSYFAQNWRLFAPNPVAQDREIRFQVAYRDEAGDVQQTSWINWTGVELDVVDHRLVGGRAGYITNKLTSSISSRYRTLTENQRRIVDTTTDEDPLSWEELRSQLSEADAAAPRPDSFLRYERVLVRLGSDIAAARFPDRDVVAVRYGVGLQGVTPYAARGGSEAEREEARPNRTERLSGWRAPVRSPVAERNAVRDFDARHR